MFPERFCRIIVYLYVYKNILHPVWSVFIKKKPLKSFTIVDCDIFIFGKKHYLTH
jgi:hypothetical protein